MYYPGMSSTISEVRLLCDLLHSLFELQGCELLLAEPSVGDRDLNAEHRRIAANSAATIIVILFIFTFFLY